MATSFETFFPVDSYAITRNPKEWWAEKDKQTSARYDTGKPLPPHHYRDQPEAFYQSYLNEDVLLEFVSARRLSNKGQLEHSRLFVDLLVEDGFEEAWTSLSVAEQERHFLAAFKTVEKHFDYSTIIMGKADCPELNRAVLFRDSGRGFIDLLRDCILHDNSQIPKQPVILVNSRFDQIIGYRPNDKLQSRVAMHSMARMTRTSYIGTVAFAVVLSTKGEDLTFKLFTTEHSKTKPTLKANSNHIKETMGPVLGKEYKKALFQRRKEMSLYCQYCLKPEEKAVTGKMTVCSRCRPLGREIRYCGRECQMADWKSHKVECGKALDISAALADIHIKQSEITTERKPRPDIPPCPPDHKRTPHTIRLIEHLETRPLHDYLRDFEGDEFNSVSLDELSGATIFIHMRNILFTSTGPGAEEALLYLYRVLQNYAPGGGGERGLQMELKREFGMPLWNRMQQLQAKGAPFPMRDISRAEIDRTLAMLKAGPRFKEELMSYTVGQGRSLKRGVAVGPRKDLVLYVDFPVDAAPPPIHLTLSGTRTMTGASAVGPNFNIPAPVDDPPKGYYHARFCDISEQVRYLQMNPTADYMVWGHPDSPTRPMALEFNDFTSAHIFLYYRHMLFKRGGYDVDALVYVIMALVPALRRRKISEEMILAQLGREYSEGYVKMARDSISRRESDGKEVYTRRDGKVFEMGEIPMGHEDLVIELGLQMKAAGKFAALLANLKAP